MAEVRSPQSAIRNSPRVLLFTRPGIGGAAAVVEHLVRRLPAEGVELTVLCSPIEDPAYPHRLSRCGVPVHRVWLEREPSPSSDLEAYLTLARLLREGRFDVVHAQTTKPGFLARHAVPRVAPGTRVVYSPHGFYFAYAPSSAWREFYLALERAQGAETDLLIASSDQEAQRAVDEGIVPQERVEVVPNGVDLDALDATMDSATLRALLDVASDQLLVTMASRMAPPKDPVTFVHAAARIAPKHPCARFLLIGDGPLRRPAEEEASRLGVQGVVLFRSPIPSLAPLLRESIATVLSSASEGLPMAVVESLGCRTPVVASDLDGCRALIDDGVEGFLFPHGSDERLASALDRLLSDDSLRTRMGEAGRRRVEKRHDARRMARRVAEAYRRCLRGV